MSGGGFEGDSVAECFELATFALTHYSADTFAFDTIGENAAGLGGAVFTPASNGQPARVVLDFYNQTGLGTFTRL